MRNFIPPGSRRQFWVAFVALAVCVSVAIALLIAMPGVGAE